MKMGETGGKCGKSARRESLAKPRINNEDVLIISTDAYRAGNRRSNLICGLDKFQRTCSRVFS